MSNYKYNLCYYVDVRRRKLMSTKYTATIDAKISRKDTLVKVETFLEIIGLYMFYLILKEINKKRSK